jgi:predicted extracellular nuclease
MPARAARRLRVLLVLLLLAALVPVTAAGAQQPGPLPIGAVQGAVADDADGLRHRSPFAPPSGNAAGAETVTVQAVVTQETRSGSGQRGLFVQDTVATADGDPATSDGLFVFIGTFDTLRVEGGGFYIPAIGDEVVLRGRVTEFFSLTQLANPFVVRVVRTGVDLDAEVPAEEVDPPQDLAEAQRWWERREGQRLTVPAGAVAVDGRDVFGDVAAGADGEAWVLRGDDPRAQREDPYARRVFRDPHPLDDVPGELFDNGNGARILLASLGLKAATDDETALIAPTRTGDTVTGAVTGGLYFAFGKYQIQVAEQLELARGADPAGNAPPSAAVAGAEYATAVYNVENLYDAVDDPTDGCDAADDEGCPGVRPPFDYVPASADAHRAKLADLAIQIVEDLGAPDVLAVQEAEDQDLCTVDGGALACGETDDADGRPDVLQDLALAVAAAGGPAYDAALDRDGADDRGITSGFLYRTDRVELLPAAQDDPVLGAEPGVTYRGAPAAGNADVANPKALNADLPDDVDTSTGTDGDLVFTRAPQVGRFRIWRDGIGASTFTDVWAVSNHFSSGPDGRVGQRTEQAAYNAAIAAAVEGADPGARVLVGGDLNVFPRPDDPFAPGDPLFPSDQLAPLHDGGLTNLYDLLLAEVPAAAYSYVFQGQTQTLDHQFASPALVEEVVEVRAAHVNADFPQEEPGDRARGISDHDPQHARFSALPDADRLADLVRYLVDEGLIRPGVEPRLLRVLDAAAAAEDAGDAAARDRALRRFRILVRVLAAGPVDPAAAAALIGEATAAGAAGAGAAGS